MIDSEAERMNMQMIRCTRCMHEMKEGERYCPYCGYDQQGEAQPSNALRRGTVLQGRYLIGNVIGQGGFGITYVGYDLTLEMKVAVKEYFPSGSAMRTGSISGNIQWDFGENEEKQWAAGIDRFLKEARRMARLDSVPSVVRVRDCFKENQTAYIVMDFVEGVTLKNYLMGHGVMRWEECLRLLGPILDSLAVIHDNGFIHRDISPDNIMLQPDGNARLLDMGAAIDVQASGGRASMVVVKRNFSAPEQYLESEALGSWTDVYSMAATIYYCLTGKVVPEAMEREFKKMPLAFAPEFGIPQSVASAINAGLELKAEERIRDMREFKARLTGIPAGAADQVRASGSNGDIPSLAADQTSATASYYGGSSQSGRLAEQPQKPVKKARFILISALIIIACSFVTIVFFKSSGNGLWSMTLGGVIAGWLLLSNYNKKGQYKKGERCFYACLAFSTTFGWLSGTFFGILLYTALLWKEKKETNQPVSLGIKVGTAASGVCVTVMLLLSAIGLTMYYGNTDASSAQPVASAETEASAVSAESGIEAGATLAPAETEAETSLAPVETKADWYDEEDDFGCYSLNDDGTYTLALCYSGNSNNGLLQVPETFNGKAITAIESYCFMDSELQQVRFPSSVKRIEAGAFSGCENLRMVFLPASVETVEGPLIKDGEEMNHRVVYFTSKGNSEIEEMDWAEDWNGSENIAWTWYSGMDFLEDTSYKGWRMDSNDDWLYYEDGFTRFGWQTINGKTYYFGENAAALTGWQENTSGTEWFYFDEENCDQAKGWREIDGEWYYFDLEDGHMLESTTTPDGYWVDENGVYSG